MQAGIRLGVCVALACASGLHAQSPGEFSGLKPGQIVRVSTNGGSRLELRLGGTTGETAGELLARGTPPFDIGRVDSLWTRGRATGTGALVGAAVTGSLSLLITSVACVAYAGSEGDGSTPERCNWGGVVLLSAVGAAGGALIGAGVGALIPKWHLRYARDRGLTIGPMLAPRRIGVALRF